MNTKRGIGLIVFVVGIIFILYANYQQNRVAEAQENVQKGKSLFSEHNIRSKAGQEVGTAIQNKLSTYNTPLKILMIGGIIFVIIGGGMALFCRKKSKRR